MKNNRTSKRRFSRKTKLVKGGSLKIGGIFYGAKYNPEGGEGGAIHKCIKGLWSRIGISTFNALGKTANFIMSTYSSLQHEKSNFDSRKKLIDNIRVKLNTNITADKIWDDVDENNKRKVEPGSYEANLLTKKGYLFAPSDEYMNNLWGQLLVIDDTSGKPLKEQNPDVLIQPKQIVGGKYTKRRKYKK
jgi:hypothetical protein